MTMVKDVNSIEGLEFKGKNVQLLSRFMVGLALAGALLLGRADAQIQVGITAGGGGDSFYVAIGDYYRVPEREIVIVRDRRVPDDEIPVVFFIASRAHVSSKAVLEMRLGGSSWMDIALHFGLGPEVFYVPVRGHYGPPYGRAYGYFKKDRRHWKSIRLRDADVVNFVNLRFMSEHYGYSPDEVIRMRSEGRNFRTINDHFRDKKFKKRDARVMKMNTKEKSSVVEKKSRGNKGRGDHGRNKDHDKDDK